MSGEGVYAAFLRACNVSDDTRHPTERVHLEDAFGQVCAPIDLGKGNRFAYEPRPLQPDACIPAPDTAAARTFDGATLAFAVPFDQLGERAFILELRAPGGDGPARIELDL